MVGMPESQLIGTVFKIVYTTYIFVIKLKIKRFIIATNKI